MLAKDDTERTVCHVATKMDNVNVLKDLWEWAKKRLITDEVNKIVISQTHNGIDQLARCSKGEQYRGVGYTLGVG